MLKFYNSLSKRTEKFVPLKGKTVGIYVCGPTVYGPTHLGHARTWIFFDWLRRYLIFKGFQVKFVQNITDVGHLLGDAEQGEDKIEEEARKRGQTPAEIARFYEKEYFEDLTALNILRPDVNPRAADHVREIIKFIQVLIKKGYAYEVSGNVYFDVSKFSDYGKLSSRDLDHLRKETRVKIDSKKKEQADFILWLKATAEHLQKWPSPWGKGFPGWHIECSVMSAKYLGQPFDIHGSASEHIFPHHENEIAQSRAYAGKPLARFFLHSGMLLIKGRKMSKSSENYLTVQDILKTYDIDTIKLAFMMTFWRKPFNWPAPSAVEGPDTSGTEGQESTLSEATKIRVRLVRAKIAAKDGKSDFSEEFYDALDNDFNTPKALAIILKNLNGLKLKDFEAIEKIFGFSLEEGVKLTKKQEEMLAQRKKARLKGDWQGADKIRKTLEEEGLILEDTPSGPRVLTK